MSEKNKAPAKTGKSDTTIFNRDNTEKALNEIYQNVTMSKSAIDNLIPYTSEDLQSVLGKQSATYDEFIRSCETLGNDLGIEVKDASWTDQNMAKMGIKMKMMADKSDNNVAKIMLQGTLMGVIDLTTLMHHTDELHNDVIHLANEVLNYEEVNMKNMYSAL